MGFPKDFVWGAASSAYQVEGAAREDGKGPSIWDVFCAKPGAILNGDTGDVSCDHYHRYAEDIALMKEIGIRAYRLSISWPRVMPGGNGIVNAAGLDFYKRLLDELLKAGIAPYVTLFHWDYPYELFRRGGWLNPDSPKWFGEYAQAVARGISDRAAHWFTMNEPQVACCLGHQAGAHAPGLKLGMKECLQIVHHMLLANGLAIDAVRRNSRQPCVVGEALACRTAIPETLCKEDIDAAKAVMFPCGGEDLFANPVWMDPLFLGEYPESVSALHEKHGLRIPREDMAAIRQPVDFLGINIYSSDTVRMGGDGKPEIAGKPAGYPKMALENWPVSPEGLYWGPRLFYERYGKPIVVTENGFAGCDWACLDGKVHDAMRIDCMNRYLNEYLRAIEDGVAAWGYFYWSAIDDFEWAWGYTERFGLIFVDFTTQQRLIKDSGRWYKRVIETNGGSLLPN